MVSITDLELIENVVKWNLSEEVGPEIIIERAKEEKYNITNDVYKIDDSRNVTAKLCGVNGTDNITKCNLESDYVSIEVSVVIILFLLIIVTVIGNTLIISAVVTTKRLRTVTNCFVTSLAAADLLVGIFVMPPAIAVHISGKLDVFFSLLILKYIFQQT